MLSSISLWSHGPNWLIKDEENWSKSSENENTLNGKILDANVVSLTTLCIKPQYLSLIDRYLSVDVHL